MGFKLGKMLTLTYTKRNQIKTIVKKKKTTNKPIVIGNSLLVQWLGLRTSNAMSWGSIHGLETKIPQAVQCG